MKPFLFFLVLTFMSKASPAQTTNADSLLKENAIELAKKFINVTNPDEAMNLCNLPFALDQKEIVTDRGVLKNRFKEMFIAGAKEKAERKLKIKKLEIISAELKQEILYRLVSINVYIIKIKIIYDINEIEPFETIQFAVQITGEPKIIGISD